MSLLRFCRVAMQRRFLIHQAGLAVALIAVPLAAQTPQPTTPPPVNQTGPTQLVKPLPALDLSSMDPSANPCDDFYKYACGNFTANHPIPADQPEADEFSQLENVDQQELNEILQTYEVPANQHTPNEQKIGDDYAACMDTALINQKGLDPLESLFGQIDRVTLPGLAYLAGELQRDGVNVFFSYGEMQDYKDATKQIAVVDQGGLGLPERGYYTRTGEADVKLRKEYVAYIAKMLTLGGETAQQAMVDAQNILAFETKLADASMSVTERRDPKSVYHPETLTQFETGLGFMFEPFLQAIHSPAITSLNNANPGFMPAMVAAVKATDMHTLQAYMKFHVMTAFARMLPDNIDDASFDFYGRTMEGQPEQRPRWKRCVSTVDNSLGEALGQVYAAKYFPPSSKAAVLQMVHDIEAAMAQDLNSLTWMSPETKAKAEAKLALVTDKIGYPDKWRNYSKLEISRTDAFGNLERANAFENDRELNKIGKPVDKGEWDMTPPTVNAYYDPSQNNINFPAGILQPAFYDPNSTLATNYGHIGAVMGHELTHGFDDQGSQFNGEGDMVDWWTPADKAAFQQRTGCLVNEYGKFSDDGVNINGKLTLGENTADNGGLLLAYMAYLERAKKDGIDINRKIDGFTGPQRFYIAFAQNWCSNWRPQFEKEIIQTDPHSPDKFRVDGVLVNQPGFGPAFDCKKGTPMVPEQNCRVW